MALTRDQLIEKFKLFGRTQGDAETEADAKIAADAAQATKMADAKAACDYAWSLKRQPGESPGAPVWNDTTKRVERASS